MADEETIVTLVDEDGKEEDFSVEEIVEIDDQRYAILVPVECLESEEDDEDLCEEEAVIMRVETDENGEDYLTDIEDDDEFERVIEALDAFDEDDEDFDDDDADEDENEDEDEY